VDLDKKIWVGLQQKQLHHPGLNLNTNSMQIIDNHYTTQPVAERAAELNLIICKSPSVYLLCIFHLNMSFFIHEKFINYSVFIFFVASGLINGWQ
jgi:hypothetical protein